MNQQTIISIDPALPKQKVLQNAVKVLRDGGLIVYPTDTCYGLGADAANPEAVGRLLKAKNRPEGMPLPVLIGSRVQLDTLCRPLEWAEEILMDHFWPGALTLVLQAQDNWKHLASKDNGIGVRMPLHPVPVQIAHLLGRPIIGTSANASGAPSPADPKEIQNQIPVGIDMILDAGPLPPSTGSTVLQVRETGLYLFREGEIARKELEKAIEGKFTR